MKRLLSILLVLIIILCNGCIEKKSTGSFLVSRDYIAYNIGKLPEDLVMLNNNDIRSKDLLCAMFEGLIKTDEENKIVPALAESYNISKDKICYTFKIRENAMWSDGSKINAEDFVSFFQDILNPDTDNIFASELYCIFGAKDYRENKKDFKVVAIRAIDDLTLEIRLNSPCDNFLDILCNPVFSLRKIDTNLEKWKENYNKIKYSGPFKIKSISAGNNISIVKNENYWDSEDVKSSKIIFTTLENGESSLANFESNQIDIFTNPPDFELSKLTSENKILCQPSLTESLLIFNLKNNSDMNNSNFRKAIAYDINRNDLVSESVNGKLPATDYIPAYISNYGFKKMSAFFNVSGNIETAKKYLLNSKYASTNKIKLVYLNGSQNKKDCDTIAKALTKDLNVKIEAKGYNNDDLSQIIKEGNYDIIKTDYIGFYDDAYAYLQYFSNENSLNIYGYNNYAYSSLVYKIKLEQDNSKRDQLMIEAEKMLMDDMPMIPLYFFNTLVCKNTNVEGIYISSIGNVKLDRVYKKASP